MIAKYDVQNCGCIMLGRYHRESYVVICVRQMVWNIICQCTIVMVCLMLTVHNCVSMVTYAIGDVYVCGTEMTLSICIYS